MDGEWSFICQMYKSIPDTNIVTTKAEMKLKFVELFLVTTLHDRLMSLDG